jgi:serine/threonine-protein kinase
MALAARIVADACAGLHAAHEAVGPDGVLLGVVHRDVSPPNILLSLQGQVKVSDFGIAKARFQLHSRTRTGEIKGKFAYIAPEQIGGRNIDRRADIFALGCVLYVSTVGLRPFGSGPRAMSKILAGEYKRPSSLIEGYPIELERVIARCLQKSPADRFASADEMRTELERWLLAAPTPIGTKDLANLVSQRLDPSKRGVVETLMRSNQFLPEAMVYQLVRGEVEQTPTATSSVMFGPASLTLLDAAEPISQDVSAPAQKPMVRFTALGRPITAESPERSASKPVGAGVEDGTISEGAIAGLLMQSSQPPRAPASLAPTFRPPRLGPLRRASDAAGWSRTRTAAVLVAVLLTLALGWGSCELLLP